MKGPVLAIRPEPGCAATVRVGLRLGLPIEGCPLFEIRPLAWEPPAPAKIDALLLGSANAARHAGPALARFIDKPAYVVGPATARAAEAAGLTVATVGRGGLQGVIDAIAPPARLLRLAGAERVPLERPLGLAIETRAVYESVARTLPAEVAARLRQGCLVLLHSAVAASHFAAECDRCAVARGRVTIAALGPRVAQAAGEGWREVRSATEPREGALLALAREMCHDLPQWPAGAPARSRPG